MTGSAAVRVGMIGAGAVATRHVQTLLATAGVRVAAVADPAIERARRLAGLGGATAYASHLDMLERERLDAAYVCVPPFAHGAPELAVIDAGLPLFVEKPVAIDLETAAAIAARLAGRSLLTCTGYHWRWLDIFDRAADLLAANPARLVSCSWLDKVPPPPWWLRRDGSGGQTIEQTTHVLDLARALVGEVTEVQAFGTRAAGADVDEVSVGSLRFAGGAVGSLTSTFLLPHLHRAGIEVVADGMWLSLSETELVVEADGERTLWRADGDARPRPDRDFVQAVRGGPDRIRVPWPEAYRTHRLACALTRSADEGRPVALDPVEVAGRG
ncbi:MAG TPA: Gfo/Idh/MocA family oxidoreductase [Actinomycetota bacterium]|nr:Gfo/Idh/MocA family oxidoreductase [Actinomycetota bacterium]